jgi:hypothetical protein
MTIINIAIDLLLTILFSVSPEIIATTGINEIIRIIIYSLFSVGIIIVAIRCRYRFGILIGFIGYFLGGIIEKILLEQYFPGWENTATTFTYILYGIYYYLIGILYKYFIDKKYSYKNIIIFSLLLYFIIFIIIGLGTMFMENPKLFIYALGDKTIIMGIIFHCIMETVILFGILSFRYAVKNYKRKYVA